MKNDIENLQNESDVISFIDKIKYGSTYFISKNNDVISFIDNCVAIINESLNKKALYLEEEKFIDELEFRNCRLGDGLYKIVSNVDKEAIPDLNIDSYYIDKKLNEAFNTKAKVRISLDQSLHKYAKKIAKNNVIFDVDENGPFFLGTVKLKSIYDQITEAFYSGNDYISFDVKKVSVATVRCYTSTISKMSGKKFRCNIDENFVVVRFKPMTDYEEVKSKIIPILKTFNTDLGIRNFLNELSKEYLEVKNDTVINENNSVNRESKNSENLENIIKSVSRELYGKPVTEEEYLNAKNWQRLGFASEYNWENDIDGDIDMYPEDVRIDDNYEDKYEDEDNDF